MCNKQSETQAIDIETQTAGREQGGRRIQGIDGLKAIAIIGVTLFHMFPQVFRGGYLGVSLFLLLTGYLLAFTSAKTWQLGKFTTIRYFLKRIQRIYPSLIIVILTTIGVYHFLLPDAVKAIRPEALSVLLGYNNWWQIHQNADYFTRLVNASPFTHLWFMGIEIQYFVLWPILFFIYRVLYGRIGPNIALGLVAILGIASAAIMPYLYVPGQDVTRLYYGTDTRVYAMLFGAYLGLLRAHWESHGVLPDASEQTRDIKEATSIDASVDAGMDEHRGQNIGKNNSKKAHKGRGLTIWEQWIGIILFAALCIVTVVGYVLLDGQNPVVYQWAMLAFTVGFAVMILLAATDNLRIGAYLEKNPLKWIGQHCYGIFLWQYPVLFLFERLDWDAKIGNPIIYNALIVACILLLTVWSDGMDKLISRFHGLRALVTSSKRPFMVESAVIGCILMGFGIFGIVTSSDVKASDVGDLQARLAANAAAQEAENAKAMEAQAKIDKLREEQMHAEQEKRKVLVDQSLQGVACIGDSVMLGSAGALRKDLPNAYIDAKVSRYVGAGLDIAKKMDREGRLGNVVLIGLGTNGPISGYFEDETKALIAYLGNRQIFWVNNYAPDVSWTKDNNAYLEKLAKEHKNITIIDWYSVAANHKEWLSEDGIHPNLEGEKQYAKLVRSTMERRLMEEMSKK